MKETIWEDGLIMMLKNHLTKENLYDILIINNKIES